MQKIFQYFHLVNLLEDQCNLLKEFLLSKEMMHELFIFLKKKTGIDPADRFDTKN